MPGSLEERQLRSGVSSRVHKPVEVSEVRVEDGSTSD
jgi:hypothetical protein